MKTWLTVLMVTILGFGASSVLPAMAAGPQAIISWKASDSVTPVAYVGKALPTVSSPVTASVAVLSGGSFANLSGRTIYWYLDNALLGGGIGKSTITFQTAGYTEIGALRVDITDYPSGELINTAHIPTMNPRVIIVAPYAGRIFSGTSFAVHAEPYFWSAALLKTASFQWSVNGQAATSTDDPQNLSVSLESGVPNNYPVSIAVVVREAGNFLTNAQSSIILTSQ